MSPLPLLFIGREASHFALNAYQHLVHHKCKKKLVPLCASTKDSKSPPLHTWSMALTIRLIFQDIISKRTDDDDGGQLTTLLLSLYSNWRLTTISSSMSDNKVIPKCWKRGFGKPWPQDSNGVHQPSFMCHMVKETSLESINVAGSTPRSWILHIPL